MIVIHDLVKELIDKGDILATKGGKDKETGEDVILLHLVLGATAFQDQVSDMLIQNKKEPVPELAVNTLRENLKRARVTPK
jgi:hypothetical protein